MSGISQHVAMLPPEVGTIGISLRIMDSNGRLLVDLNQQLSLSQQTPNETVELDVDCPETGSSNNRVSAKTYETPTFKSSRRSSQRSQYRVRFDDSDSSAGQIAMTSSATTMSIATPPEKESKDNDMVAAARSSSENSIDLIDRINGSLDRIACFARQTTQQKQQQCQQQTKPKKQQQYVSTQQRATSSDQYTSLSCSSSKTNDLSAPAVPICIKKTAWNAEELHYAIESDTAEDDEEVEQVAAAAPATQATISFKGGFGDSNNFNVPKRAGGAAGAAVATDNALANLLCKRYQRDIIIHTIRGVVDRLYRQQQLQNRKC